MLAAIGYVVTPDGASGVVFAGAVVVTWLTGAPGGVGPAVVVTALALLVGHVAAALAGSIPVTAHARRRADRALGAPDRRHRRRRARRCRARRRARQLVAARLGARHPGCHRCRHRRCLAVVGAISAVSTVSAALTGRR